MIWTCLRFLAAPFAWQFVRMSGAWVYYENRITGQRWAKYRGLGFSPLDMDWLRPGDVIENGDGPVKVNEHAPRGSP